MPKTKEQVEFDAIMGELDMLAKAVAPVAADPPQGQVAKSAQASQEQPASQESQDAPEGGAPVMDGEEFVKKAVGALNDVVSQSIQSMETRQQQASAILAKALVAQGKVMSSLMEQIQGLKAETEELGNQPAVRKSVLSVHERQPSAQAANQETDNGHAVLKSVLSQQAKLLHDQVIGPAEVAVLEYAYNRGQGLPVNFQHLAQYATAGT